MWFNEDDTWERLGDRVQNKGIREPRDRPKTIKEPVQKMLTS